jgi:hypothetical protein
MKSNSLILLVLVLLLVGACTLNRPVCATSNPIGDKVGMHIKKSILFFPPLPNTDAAILKAAENGGITEISTVDYNVSWMLFFVEYRTIVTGR